MAQTPRILKNFNGFINGVGLAGVIEEVELPEIEFKMEAARFGGLDSEVEHEMGQEIMKATITLAEPLPEILAALNSGVRIQLRGSRVRDTDQSRVADIAEIGARMTKFSEDAWKSGEKGSNKHEVTVDYYRRTIGGVELWEIDTLNMVRRIGGVDQLAGIRADIGV